MIFTVKKKKKTSSIHFLSINESIKKLIGSAQIGITTKKYNKTANTYRQVILWEQKQSVRSRRKCRENVNKSEYCKQQHRGVYVCNAYCMRGCLMPCWILLSNMSHKYIYFFNNKVWLYCRSYPTSQQHRNKSKWCHFNLIILHEINNWLFWKCRYL